MMMRKKLGESHWVKSIWEPTIKGLTTNALSSNYITGGPPFNGEKAD